jgi:hypothetical protein
MESDLSMFAVLAALTMKTIITSNWRPPRRALCTLLLGIAGPGLRLTFGRAPIEFMQKNLAIPALCVAVLTLLPKTAFAIAFTNSNGLVVERDSISGVVVHADKDQRGFTLHWVRIYKRSWAAFDTVSYQETYRISEEIVYKNGSWANMVKGAKVRIRGHGLVVESIEFRR